MEIEFMQALLTTGGMFAAYVWGKYLSTKEIIEGVIYKTISSLAEQNYIMIKENDDGEKCLVAIPEWIETLKTESSDGTV